MGEVETTGERAFHQLSDGLATLHREVALPAADPGAWEGAFSKRMWEHLAQQYRQPVLMAAWGLSAGRIHEMRFGAPDEKTHVKALRSMYDDYARAGSLYETPATGGVFLCPWLAYNSNAGRLEIAYWEANNDATYSGGQVYWAHRGGGSWSTPELVDNVNMALKNISDQPHHTLQLLHESDGTPHVLYGYDNGGGTFDISHAKRNGAWATITPITGAADADVEDVGAAIDGGDRIGLVYYKDPGDGTLELYFASWTDGGGALLVADWTLAGGPEGRIEDLQGAGSCYVDFDATPHPVTLHGGTAVANNARYGIWGGAAWASENVRLLYSRGLLFDAGTARAILAPAGELQAWARNGAWAADGAIVAPFSTGGHFTNPFKHGGNVWIAAQYVGTCYVKERTAASTWTLRKSIGGMGGRNAQYPRSIASDGTDLWLAFDRKYKLIVQKVT